MVQDAERLRAQCGESELEGLVLLGVLAPLRCDQAAFCQYFAEAAQKFPQDEMVWVNEAVFAPYLGLLGHSAEIFRAHWGQIKAAPDLWAFVLETCLWCGLAGAAEEISMALEKIGQAPADLRGHGLARALRARGVSDAEFNRVADIAAQAAMRSTGSRMRGFWLSGDDAYGYSFRFQFDAPLAQLVDASVAMAEAVTAQVDDPLGDLVTFSAVGVDGGATRGG